MTGGSRQDEAQRLQAADWVARLQGADLGEADALAFDAWLSSDPSNAPAYDAALATSREFEANAGEVLRELKGRRAAPPRGRIAPFAWGAAAAAALAVAVAVPTFTAGPKPAVYATGVGQHRSIALADGTRIDLNAGTRMTITLGRRDREVVLDEGQAVFDVAHDAARPFRIAAGDRTIRVVGTQFDVRRRDGRLAVTVARGAVEVLPSAGASGQAFRLSPGQRLEHLDGAPGAELTTAPPEEAFSWRSGRLVYRDQPLSAVVADLNAQFAKPIRIADPALAATPISGVLILDDEDAVVRRLALLVSAQAVPSAQGVILQSRSETPNR